MEENKQLKDCQEVRYSWRIENFTSLNVSEVYSGIFEVNRCRWRLITYPKGNADGVEHLSVFLAVADTDSLPVGWSRTAKFTINLINQKNSMISIKKETKHQFKKGASDWGYPSFFPLSKLHDKYGGYLVDGRCVIEAEVSVTDVFPVYTDKPSDPSVPVDRNPVDLDVVESIYSNAKSFLMSTSKESTSIVSDIPSIKERFNDMISMPLDYFVDPKHETVMIETLSILGDNLNLFSDEQAKEIVRLKAVFPTSVQEWRDSVQVKASCQSSLSTFEKTLNLLKAFVKTEEGIKTRLEELKMREQELKALQNESQRLEQERLEVSKQTQQISALAEEQAGKVKGKEMEMAGAENKLEDLKSNWDSVKSVFIKREIFGSKHIYFGRRQFICCFLVLITAFVCYFCLNNMTSAKGTESCTELL